MAPIKFEENIKDKLESRRLSPSAGAWSKLSERLDEEDKKPKSSLFWWLSIAAGLILMIAISVQFFNTNEDEKVIPQVVDTDVSNDELGKKLLEQKLVKSTQLAIEESKAEANKDNENLIRESQAVKFKTITPNNLKSITRVTEQNDATDDKVLNKEAVGLLNEATVKNTVVDALETLKVENSGATDKEVDSLLKLASKELFKDKLQKETFKAVDADALLLSVEEDMGQSFRSKVFDALKGSYETVKTAVVQRNN